MISPGRRGGSPPLAPSPEFPDRARGALLGLVVGDALGETLKFTVRDSRPFHMEIAGGDPFDLRPSEWTDDTAQALCLAASLIRRGGLGPLDPVTRFVAWHDTGAYSCTGDCVDVGAVTAVALDRFEHTGDPLATSRRANTAGNGSLMGARPGGAVRAPGRARGGCASPASGSAPRTPRRSASTPGACSPRSCTARRGSGPFGTRCSLPLER